MGTDPFEEFEFKPLTEGLGFHQKPKTSAPAPTPSTPASSLMGEQLGAKGISFDEVPAEKTPLTAPLPRREYRAPTASSTPTPTISPVDDILNTLQKNRKKEIELDRQHRQELRQSKKVEVWKTASPKFSPMLLDAMLVTAAGLLCMIIMLIVTRVDLLTNLSNPDTEGMIYLSTISLFAGVSFIYTVTNRIFLGFTPGEWAYDLRLGRPEDQGTASFALRVVFRQILITVTGLFLLPLLGFIFGRDLAGKLSGLPLHRKA